MRNIRNYVLCLQLINSPQISAAPDCLTAYGEKPRATQTVQTNNTQIDSDQSA